MRLKTKNLHFSSGGPFVIVLNNYDASLLDVKALDRVTLKRVRADKKITAVVNISDRGVKKGEIGLFEETFSKINIEEGVDLEIERTSKPDSVCYIKKKLDGGVLSQKEYDALIRDVMDNNLSEVELAYFVAGTYTRGMTLPEVFDLTQTIYDNSVKLKLKDKVVLNKHCIGGVPGNRTSMIIVPVIAAAGFKIPKTSSRAITSAAGTADVVELVAPVKISINKVNEVIKKTNGCLVWQSSINPEGVDEKIIKIRYPLHIDPNGLLLSSIFSKKIAVGTTHLLIDIPYGDGAKLDNKKSALEMKNQFEKLCRFFKVKSKIILTDGSQPIGNGVGCALELHDVVEVLQGRGPTDLREKAIMMCANMLKMVGVRKSKKVVRDLIDSGKAYKKFLDIIYLQGGHKRLVIPTAKYYFDVLSSKSGLVRGIDNKIISSIARRAGAPVDKVAGLYLRKKKDDYVHKKDVLYTVYADSQSKLENAKVVISKDSGFLIK